MLEGARFFLRRSRKIAKRGYWLRYVCPSVRPQEKKTRLLLDGFSWNLVYEYILKICRAFGFRLNLTRITSTLHEDLCTFMVSRQILLGMRIVSDKSCRENQKTRFMFSNVFRIWRRLWDNVEKYCRAVHTTDSDVIWCMLFACWMAKATDAH